MTLCLWVIMLLFANYLSVITGQETSQDEFQKAIQAVEELREMEAKTTENMGTPVNSAFEGVSDFQGSNRLIKRMGFIENLLEEILRHMREKNSDTNKDGGGKDGGGKVGRGKVGRGKVGRGKDGGEKGTQLQFNASAVESTLESCFKQPFASDTRFPLTKKIDCCPFPKINCKPDDDIWRTFDGSCNCKESINMGRSNRAHARWEDPDYSDGISKPRVGKHGASLPSAREVSLEIFAKPYLPGPKSPIITAMYVSFGQLIDHDLTRTPISKLQAKKGFLVDVPCGTDGCEIESPENQECFPIPLPFNEPIFKGRCLKFVRSQAFLADECKPGPRRQANTVTSWADASFLYGSNKNRNKRLRDENDRALMKSQKHPFQSDFKPLLPTTEDSDDCIDAVGKIKCFLAGDGRSNEQIGLTALHTIFMRLHNYIAIELRKVNPKWSPERVFQETRRIVIAIYQNIVYYEYLPLLLGDIGMKTFRLGCEQSGCIEHNCKEYNGDVSSVFATAAFRYGHSIVPEEWLLRDKYKQNQAKWLPIPSILRRPHQIYFTHFGKTSGVDAIMFGHMRQSADKTDHLFSSALRDHLFTLRPPFGQGIDLTALNIQRGRDHGIPGYNRWREFCGLPKARDFDDMIDIPEHLRYKFKRLYKHVDDVDVFPAAMSEYPVPGALIGKTFSCLIGLQFRNLAYADRFWYDTCDKGLAFTKAQLHNIKEYTTGRLLCDTLDDVHTVKKFALMKSWKEAVATSISQGNFYDTLSLSIFRKDNNEERSCSFLPKINFHLWKDRSDEYAKPRMNYD